MALYWKAWGKAGNTDDASPTFAVTTGGKWGAVVSFWRGLNPDLFAETCANRNSAGATSMTADATQVGYDNRTVIRFWHTGAANTLSSIGGGTTAWNKTDATGTQAMACSYTDVVGDSFGSTATCTQSAATAYVSLTISCPPLVDPGARALASVAGHALYTDITELASAPTDPLYSVWVKLPAIWAARSGAWGRGNQTPWLVRGTNWEVRCICGNMSVDSTHTAPVGYNINTMLFAEGSYIADFTFVRPDVSFDEAVGWVWVAYQIQIKADRLTINQWWSFGDSGTLDFVTEDALFSTVRTAIGNPSWTPSAPGNMSFYDGGIGVEWSGHSSDECVQFNGHMLQTSSVPSDATLLAIAQRTAPDTSAWADWPYTFESGGANVLNDVSGNARHQTYMAGTFYQAEVSPYDLTGGGTGLEFTATGGAVAGGSSVIGASEAVSGVSGSVAGGASGISAQSTVAGIGGGISGGTGEVGAGATVGGSGGPVVGGSSAAEQASLAAGSAGVVVGGAGGAAAQGAVIGSGGAVTGGAASVQADFQVTGAAGALAGGSASASASTTAEGIGGAVAGGESTVDAPAPGPLEFTATGGAVAGGVASVIGISQVAASGGAVVGGASQVASIVAASGSAGTVAGGASVTLEAVAVVGTGGAVAGGSGVSRAIFVGAGVGGAVVGGAAEMAAQVEIVAGGGAVSGGASAALSVSAIIGTGGVVAGGTSPVESPSAGPLVFVATGGAVAGGVTTVVSATSSASIGGLVTGGYSSSTAAVACVATAGTVAGGTSSVYAALGTLGVGGAVAGGTSTVVAPIPGPLEFDATGGAVAGGHSTITGGSDIAGIGGAVAGGTSDIVAPVPGGLVFSATGGVVAGGASTVALGSVIVGVGGAVAGGTSDTLNLKDLGITFNVILRAEGNLVLDVAAESNLTIEVS